MSTETTRAMDAIIANGQRNHGERFDPSELDPRFARFSRFGGYPHTRIKVRVDDWEQTGTVGMTTGWRPAFLLIRRSSDDGSSIVLGPEYDIVAIKHPGARSYRPVHPCEVTTS